MPRIDLTIENLGLVVLGLSMVPAAGRLYDELATTLHVEQSLPVDPCWRRVTWTTLKDGRESCVEFYDERICARLDAAIARVLRPRRRPAARRRRARC